MKIAIFPGSFDPITKGHEDIIKRAIPMFDKIVVAMGINTSKKYLFDETQRLLWIQECFKDNKKIDVISYQGLTTDFAQSVNAKYIVRGLRNTIDFEYEKSIAEMNKKMVPGIETVFLFTDPSYAAISSTIVRELIRNNTDVSSFLPEAVKL